LTRCAVEQTNILNIKASQNMKEIKALSWLRNILKLSSICNLAILHVFSMYLQSSNICPRGNHEFDSR
jgi:hypothetical protein